MDSDAFELQRIEWRIVEIGPGCSRRRTGWTLPNAAIGAGKNISGAIKYDRVVVCVQTVAIAGECVSAVCRYAEQPSARVVSRRASLATYVNDISVIWIDGNRHVIKALTGTKSSATCQR